jgi:hypothetical protein
MSQRIIDRSFVGHVLQHIYASDLNVQITLFSSAGYFYIAEQAGKVPLQGTTIEEAVTDLATRLAKNHPDSSFTSWWLANVAEEDTTG